METLLINKILLLVAFVEIMILAIGGTIMLCKWMDKILNKKLYKK